MQRKSIIIPIIALLVVGGVWASSSLFLSPTGFPANPATPGTIGYILGLFGIDGTARDSAALAGRSATGYLQGNNCTAPGEVWRGIDTSGKAVCGTRSTLLAIGKFCQQTPTGVTVLRGGSGPGVAANMTDMLESGDIIQTNGGTATVCFDADSSIMRLDQNTVVALSVGDLGGKTVAQAILTDGQLWGRVLTSTGINIGGGGLIAGVRGTSISVIKESDTTYIAIPHSTQGGGAAHITCPGGTTDDMGPGEIINTNSACSSQMGSWGGVGTIGFYNTNEWVRKNTRADIAYLESLATSSQVAKNELIVTLPQADERTPLCINYDGQGNNGTWFPSGYDCQAQGILAMVDYNKSGADGMMVASGSEYTKREANICPNGATDSCTKVISATCNPGDAILTEQHSCDWPSKAVSFTPTAITTPVPGYSYDCVVPADPTTHYIGDQTYGGVWTNTNYYSADDSIYGGARLSITCAKPVINMLGGLTPTLDGISIHTPGQYIGYETGAVSNAVGGTLANKMITIDLTTPTNNGVILDMGSACKITKKASGWNTNFTPCAIDATSTVNHLVVRLSNNTITQFYIGNQKALGLPIGANIQKITIQKITIQ